jgi:hypothetical protein
MLQILHQDALLKPLNMVQQFLTPLSNEDMSQQDNFKERQVSFIGGRRCHHYFQNVDSMKFRCVRDWTGYLWLMIAAERGVLTIAVTSFMIL